MTLIKEGKKFFEAGTKQVSYQLEIVNKKLKIYGFQKKISVEMNKLGEICYNLIQEKRKDIKKNKKIIELVESIKEQQQEIDNTDREIIDIQNNFQKTKGKMLNSGRSLYEKIIQGSPSNSINDQNQANDKHMGPNPLDQKNIEFRNQKKMRGPKAATKK